MNDTAGKVIVAPRRWLENQPDLTERDYPKGWLIV